ncbi:MAG: carbohydrate kinase [Candidatus Nealsonbacteria bacterium]|nr:carbohydrate kinase [Candidatus Nealsonbacteria bacterium]
MNEQVPAIVGLGEILWDVFPDGPRFGGAPANFACHVAALGRTAEIAAAVGQDELGKRALAELHTRGVGTRCVDRHADRPTGTVTVSLDDEGQASYEFAAQTAWDAMAWSEELAQLAPRTSAVCFGTLGQRSERSRETIQRFVAATSAALRPSLPAALRIFDVNLRPPFVTDPVILQSLDLANVLKLNDEELPVVAALCKLTGTDVEVMQQLADRFTLRAVALTRGPRGAVLIRDDQVSEHPGVETQVVDTVGAGDAFTAVLALGLLDGSDLAAINTGACQVAAFVCSQGGATPQLPGGLVNTQT